MDAIKPEREIKDEVEEAEEELEVVVAIQREQCVVCGGAEKIRTCFGKSCCNACNMLLRRSTALYKDKVENPRNWNEIRREEKFQRHQRMLNSGLLLAHYETNTSSETFLPRVLTHLEFMESYRTQKFEWENVQNITPTLAIQNFEDRIQYSRKPAGAQMTCVQWSLLNQITSVDFLKKFEVVRNGFLSSQDAQKFLEHNYIKHMLFATAWRNFNQKEGALTFPGGVNVLSKELETNKLISDDLKKKIRGQIIDTMIRLNMKNEEYMLLSAIFAMDSDIPLSENGIALLEIHQNYYATALRKFCTKEYGEKWITRFMELLGVVTVINHTYENFCALVQLYMAFQRPSEEKRKFENLTKFADAKPE